MSNGCFAQHTLWDSATNNLSDKMHWWGLSHFFLILLSHFSVSPFFTLYFPDPGHFSLPMLHTLFFVFSFDAELFIIISHWVIAAGAMNSRYICTAGGTSCWWLCNCIDVPVCVIANVVTITGCGVSPDDLSAIVSLTPPVKSFVLQSHLSTSYPLNIDTISSPVEWL